MSILTSRNELLTASGLDWLHIVDVSDTSSSPQGTSKKIKLDNLLLNYLGFDSRYYTKTEINNFYSGATSISGYNKEQWDSALTPDENGDYNMYGNLNVYGEKTTIYNEDFSVGTGDFNNDSGSDADWSRVTNEGNGDSFSLKAGTITADQASVVGLTLTGVSVGDKLLFDYKVSSESGSDFFVVQAELSTIVGVSGEVDWTTFEHTLVEDDIVGGNATFFFIYVKDSSGSSGDDTAWIDNVKLERIVSFADINVLGGLTADGLISGTGGMDITDGNARIETSTNYIDINVDSVSGTGGSVVTTFNSVSLTADHDAALNRLLVTPNEIIIGSAGNPKLNTIHGDTTFNDGLFLYDGVDTESITTSDVQNWNDAFGWGNHALAGYLESLQGGQGTVIDNTDPVNPLVNLGGTIDDEVIIDMKAEGLGASFSIQDIDQESNQIYFDHNEISIRNDIAVRIHAHEINEGLVDIRAGVVNIKTGAKTSNGLLKLMTPDVFDNDAVAGQVLTLIDEETGEVDFRDTFETFDGTFEGNIAFQRTVTPTVGGYDVSMDESAIFLRSTSADNTNASNIQITPTGINLNGQTTIYNPLTVYAATQVYGSFDVFGTITGDGSGLTNVQLTSEKGAANGYAPLNGSGIIDQSYLPSYVDDVLEYADFASFPATGEAGKIYIDLAQNDIYRWSGSVYVEVAGTAPTTWGSITGTLSNQTDLQNTFDGKVDVSGDTMTGTLIVPQLEMNQSANYFQPTTNDDKILFIGGNGSGVRDWSNIFFYTGGVFRMNGEDIVTMSQNTGRVNEGEINFSGSIFSNGTQIKLDSGTTFGKVSYLREVSGTDYESYLTVNGGSGAAIWQWLNGDGDNTYLEQTSIGLRYNDGSTNRTVWHSGNDGAGSGLNADTLRGLFPSNFAQLNTTTDNANKYLLLHREIGGGSAVLYVNQTDSAGSIARFYKGASEGSTSGTDQVSIESDGSIIATGNITADDFIQSSDERLKSNIQPLETKPIKADWKSFEMKDRKRVGVIAQELEENHPEFVHTNEEGYKSVSYIDLLVAKIHELENRIKQLEG